MKKKKFNWGGLLIFGGSLAVGIGLGVMLGEMMVLDGLSLPQMLGMLCLYMAVMVLALWLNTAIHEAGHLVFGLLTGYGFCSFRLGSLMILKENGKLRLCKYKLAGTGGQCLMTPPELVDGKMPFALYNLGGCMFNFAVTLVCGILWLLMPDSGLLSVFFLSMAVMGLILGASNGIPVRMGLVQNDGMNTLALYRRPEAIRAMRAQLLINQGLSAGLRGKDMPAEWFWMPTAEERKDPVSASAGVMYCNRLMDEHRFDEAREAMELMMAPDTEILPLHRRALTCDLIYCELIGQRRWDVVEGMLNKEQKSFMQAMATNITVLRTQYLLALYHENDSVKARAFLARFEKQAAAYPYSGDAEAERELIAIADERRALTDGI